LYKNKKIFGLITARANSKRLRNKNTLILSGKPVFYYTVIEALKSKYLDQLFLSTNDHKIIRRIKRFPKIKLFKRSHNLSKDKSKTEHLVLKFINEKAKKTDIICLLQPTSPFRKSFDIDNSIKKMVDKKSKAIITVSKNFKNIKDSIKVKKNFYFSKCKKFVRNSFTVNGAFYAADIEFFKRKKTFITKNTLVHIMPKNRSLDIDTKEDFLLAKKIIKVKK